MGSRQLRLYELICLPMNINFMIEFEADNDKFGKGNLIEAFKYVKKKHPYFRMRVKPIEDNPGQFEYVEEDTDSSDIYLDHYTFDRKDSLLNWQERLTSIAFQPRDHSKSLVYFELYSYSNLHQLFASVNHSGIDGPGVFVFVKDLCYFIDSSLSGNISSNVVESRPFYDIHNVYDESIESIESLKNEIIIKENYLLPIASNQTNQNSQDKDKETFIPAEFLQLDEHQTRNFLINCKNYGSTVQGALSVAVMVSLIKEKLNEINDDKSQIRVINGVPCNMRTLLKSKLTNDDIVCGSALLTWVQEFNLKEDLWTLASNATKQMHESRDSNQGMKWWIKLKNSIPTQSISIMSSSMGVVSLNENSLKNIKIKDLRFLGSAYSLPPNRANTMVHAFTFLNRFTFDLSYTYPALSKEWAKNFSLNILKVIEYFASDNPEQVMLNEFLEKLNEFKQNNL